ncbi:hypothetical protein [Kocuria sp. SL71]|uniref:hypothetical protein n=1 Tax=Kocuria sp. SL71 TaxID=2995151 RepID=UPI00227422BB|nr:hypothetical protein [Kocuria sp. SL71]MCY1683099.1 hypothetical protein [Kocuria sp. SL71]
MRMISSSWETPAASATRSAAQVVWVRASAEPRVPTLSTAAGCRWSSVRSASLMSWPT